MHGVLAAPSILIYRDRPGLMGAGISDRDQLEQALRRARAGETIELAPVVFDDGPFLVAAVKGITIRSSVPRAAMLRSELSIVGDGITVEGLSFDPRPPAAGGFLQVGPVEDWLRLREKRAAEPDPPRPPDPPPLPPPSSGPGPAPEPGNPPAPGKPGKPAKPGKPGKPGKPVSCGGSMSITGRDVEVAGCDFGYFSGRAILVRPPGLRAYIHHCGFHDGRPNPRSSNANSAVTLGYDNVNQFVSMRARLIANRFWSLPIDGAVVTVKTSDNTIEGNEVSDSQGGFVNRLGQNSLFQNNTSINSRGVVVGGRGIRVIGNTVHGQGSIVVQSGTAAPGKGPNSAHPQSVDVFCQDNNGTLVIGGGGFPKPALGTVVASHNGQIRLLLESGTRLS